MNKNRLSIATKNCKKRDRYRKLHIYQQSDKEINRQKDEETEKNKDTLQIKKKTSSLHPKISNKLKMCQDKYLFA